MTYRLVLFLVTAAGAVPVQKITENELQKIDNYLPKAGELPKFHYSTDDDGRENLLDVVEFNFRSADEDPQLTTAETTTDTQVQQENFELNPVLVDDTNSTTNRTIRQEEDNSVEVDDDKANDNEKESQEDEEEEEPNMITGLISAFLGGLSRPDGSVDVEAITGLLGSLSTQNDDGTYDFSGLTELLMSFFGGTGEDGGGSNFGAFIGGIAGAFLKGIAQPPGAKGIGVFVGNLVNEIIPAIFAPAPTEEGQTQKPAPALDSGGFLGGLLSTVLGNLGNLSTGISGGSSGGGTDDKGGGGSKFSLFKAIFSTVTSLFSSSSHPHDP